MVLFTPTGGDLAEWVPLPSGRNGYRQGATRGHVRCYWDGSEGMGVHIVASGQGVDQLEAEGVIRGWEGPDGFACTLLAHQAELSRIDVAFDDRVGYLTPARIEGACREGRCVTRWKQADPRAKINLVDGSTGGWSLYLGSRSSRICARFYDKRAEQAEKGNVTEGHWMRCELEARDERADALLGLIATVGVGACRNVLFNYVDFKREGETDSNRSRWATCDWWSEFLGEVSKLRLSTAQVVQTLERSATWFRRQIAPTFALLMASSRHGEEWLQHQFEQGVARLKPWQWAALDLAGGKPVPSVT